MSTAFSAAKTAEIEVRPGVLRPDWSVVTLAAAGDALRARSSSRSSLIDCWLMALSPEEDLVWRRTLVLFANLGRAPLADEIAGDTGLGEESVKRILVTLQRQDLVGLSDGDENIVDAYPFTNRTTGHTVTFGAGRLNALCAVDALGAGAMYRQDAVIDSRCRACGAAIRIATADLGSTLSSVSPPQTVVWYDTSHEGSAASSCCTRIAFFCSDEHLNDWLRAPPVRGGRRLSVQEAFQVGRAIFGPVLVEATRPGVVGADASFEKDDVTDLQSTITCPSCGHQETETMPTDACQFFYDCKGCGTLLRPKEGDCCVYCSYGSVPCPPMQEARGSGSLGSCCAVS